MFAKPTYFAIAMLALLFGHAATLIAAPQGGEIVAGTGSIQTPDAQTTVVTQQTSSLAVDWDSFNLGADERVQFVQPGREAVALNYILDQRPSEILGRIDANGRVFLMNPNGILFGASARIEVGALVAGAFQIERDDFLRAGPAADYRLTVGPGQVTNAGVITAAEGGSVALVGNSVRNSGHIEARLGRIELLSNGAATLSFDADGLIRFAVTENTLQNTLDVESAVVNSGTLTATDGYVALSADTAGDVFANVVNNSGVIRANRVSNVGGVVRLEGTGGNVIHRGVIDVSAVGDSVGGTVSLLGERVGVLGEARIDASGAVGGGRIHIGGQARGAGPDTAQFTQLAATARLNADATQRGDGGEIVLWAEDTTWALGQVSARGGQVAGDGGFVEISGKQGLVLEADVDVSAPGGVLGTLLLDPTDIIIHDQADNAQPQDGQLPNLSDATAGAGSFDIGELALESLGATTNLILEASNNITINNLADNILNFAINNGGSITMTADTDGDGAGSLSMDASDTLVTDGAALSLSGAGVTLGGLDTNGAFDGDITVSSTTSVTLGAATAGAQNIAITIDSDADGAETLTLTGSLSAASVSLQGGANGGDTLIGPDLANTWTVSALNTGSLNGANFSSFANLSGGGGDDNFSITEIGSLSGQIDGGAQASGDSVDYSGATGIISVTLNSDIVNIETITGNNADYTLIADNVPNTWTLTGANSGTVAGVTFNAFGNLTGGSDIDTFVLSGGSVTGTITGGAGNDSLAANNAANTWNILSADGGNVDSVFAFNSIENLIGGNGDDAFVLNSGSVSGGIDGGAGNDSLAPDNVANIWTITATDAGDVTGVSAFSNIENLNGRNDTDDFSFNDGAGISGNVDGGGGTDSVNLAAQTGTVVVNLSDGSYANIEQYTGNDSDSTLIGAATANTWSLTGPGDGILVDTLVGTSGSIGFNNFTALTGGAATDSFNLVGGTLAGMLDGGAGNDTLVGDNSSNTWNISTTDAGNATGIGSFQNIEDLTGNAADDSFVFADGSSLSGVVDGAGGTDNVDFSAEAGAVVVTIGSAGFANIESFVGNNTDSTLIGDNVSNSWTFAGINDGSISSSAGNTNFIDFNNITGGSSDDTFTLGGGSITGLVDGGGGTDTLIADNLANTWTITGVDAGSVTGVNTFSTIENLTGNAASDVFQFTDLGAISGLINGAFGADTVDYSAKTGAVSVDLETSNFISIETFVGNNTNSTLLGSNVSSTWTLTELNGGTVNTINFQNFNNLIGNAAADSFILAGGGLSGAIDGGAGNDSLRGENTGAVWNLTGTDIGNITGVGAFSAIETLLGGNGVDSFNFSNGSNFSGIIDGGAGSDVVDLSAQLGTVSVDLANSGFINIESYRGNGTDSTVIGDNLPNVWTLSGVDSGDVNGIAFTGFNNLTGNAQQDQFVLSGGSLSGNLDGAAGSDTLVAGNAVNTWNISTLDAGNVDGIAAFSNMENLTGGNATDVFVFANGGRISGVVDGGAGNDTADFSAEAGSVNIALGSNAYDNIESFIGNNINSTLSGPLSSNTWTITATNDGTVGGIAFSNFNNLTGNVNSDLFQFQDGSILTGVIDGGAGLDSVDFSLESGFVNVALGSNSFLNIETFIGNNVSSTLMGDNVTNTWTITGTNDGSLGTITFMDFNNLTGNAAADNFRLNGGSISGSLDGGAGNDTLTAGTTDNTWTISAADAGSVNGVSGFRNIENLVGNSGSDNFVFSDGSSISGSVDGGAGIDSVDQSAQSGFVTITLDGVGFNNVESFIGNGTNSTLQSENLSNSWIINGADSGTVGTVAFTAFSNLQGGSGDDSFTLNSGGSLSGQIDGGTGNDLILAGAGNNVWNLTGADVGDVTGITAFTGIETLLGNSGADSFVFADGSRFSGVLDGAAGSDNVDFSSQTGAVVADLSSGRHQNIETFIGNATDSTLVGDNRVNTWTLSAPDAGDVNGIAFSAFNNLTGNASADVFVLQTGSLTGTLNGGAGNDSIQADNTSNVWNVTADDAGNVNGIAAFQNIDNLLGGSNADSFNIAANVSGNIDGAAGDDSFNLNGLLSVGAIIGGSGTDTLNGPAQDSNWTLSATDSGLINGSSFAQIENLGGGAGADSFVITNAAAAGMSGIIDGGAGNDTLQVDYSIASSRSITFNGGAGSDTLSLTGSGAGLTANYVFGSAADAVSITTGNGALTQTIDASQIEGISDTLSADTLRLTGSNGDDDMRLSPGSATGSQPASFTIAGWVPLQFANKTDINIDGGAGNDTVQIDGPVTFAGDVTLNVETLRQGNAGRLTADTLSIDQATLIGTAVNRFATNVNTLTLNGSTVDVYISETDGLALAAATISGVLDITTNSGDITSAGRITVTGSSAFTVGDGGSIILDNSGNQFAGTPVFSSTGTLNNLTLHDASAVNLQALTLSGDLNIVTDGAINQSGVLNVQGDSRFDAGNNSIDLSATNGSTTNDFIGTVSLNNSGANNVSISDQNTLIFADTRLGNGSLTVTAGSITQSGAIVQQGTGQQTNAGATRFTANNGDIALTDGGNDFTGTVYLVNTSAGDVSITESGALRLGASSTNGGDLTVNTNNSILLSDTITSAGGDILITANSGDIQLGRLNADSGRIVLNATTGNVTGNNSPITDPNVSSQNLEIITGQTLGDFNNPISVNVPQTGTSLFVAGQGTANIIGPTGTLLSGSVLVNDVATTVTAVGKGQSVSVLEKDLTPSLASYLIPLYSIVGGGVQIPYWFEGEEREEGGYRPGFE